MSDSKETPEDYSKTPIDQLWAEWKVKHEKTYESKEEEEYRFGVFKESLDHIQSQNSKYIRGESTFFCGLNHFADLKPHEVCCGGRRGPKSPNKNKAAQ